jgi:Ni2+-binding GTPase involved in maturation of urease and hydrogenase
MQPQNNLVLIAGVAGGASSGKSTVCKMIIDQLRDHRVVVVTQVCVLQLCFLIALLFLYLDCPFFHKIN